MQKDIFLKKNADMPLDGWMPFLCRRCRRHSRCQGEEVLFSCAFLSHGVIFLSLSSNPQTIPSLGRGAKQVMSMT
jgi:hypothetical protein